MTDNRISYKELVNRGLDIKYRKNCEKKDEPIKEEVIDMDYIYGRSRKINKIKNKEIRRRKKLILKKVTDGIIKPEILKFKKFNEMIEQWAISKGFKNYKEYLDIIALGRGFTCYEEYGLVWKYYPGMPSPLKENRKSPNFIGVYIGENSIIKLFDESKKMRFGNVGYDIICKKGYKIEVKACTLNEYNRFKFVLNKNNIADYFILIGFNNIIDLVPLSFWIIKSDEIINNKCIKDMKIISVTNEPIYLENLKKYEKIDKLEKLKEICLDFNTKNPIGVRDYTLHTKHEILNIVSDLRFAGNSEIFPTDILHIMENKKKVDGRIHIIKDDDEDLPNKRYRPKYDHIKTSYEMEVKNNVKIPIIKSDEEVNIMYPHKQKYEPKIEIIT